LCSIEVRSNENQSQRYFQIMNKYRLEVECQERERLGWEGEVKRLEKEKGELKQKIKEQADKLERAAYVGIVDLDIIEKVHKELLGLSKQ